MTFVDTRGLSILLNSYSFLAEKMYNPVWEYTCPGHARSPDENWQANIIYVRIRRWFFYLIILIDEYSRYIVHHNLLTAMDADSLSMEAQAAIDRPRKDSIAEPVIQSVNGSSFIAMGIQDGA